MPGARKYRLPWGRWGAAGPLGQPPAPWPDAHPRGQLGSEAGRAPDLTSFQAAAEDCYRPRDAVVNKDLCPPALLGREINTDKARRGVVSRTEEAAEWSIEEGLSGCL